MSDPFTSAFESVVNAITGSPSVTSIVSAKNIYSFLSENEPLLDYREAGDTPSLTILPDADEDLNLFHTSSTAQIPQNIIVRMMSDDEHVDGILYNLRWAICRALFTQGVTLNNAGILDWNVGAFAPTEPEDAQQSDRGWHFELNIKLILTIDHTAITE